MREEQRHAGSPAHVILDSAGVDLLELVRLGAQPSSALHHYLTDGATVLLCDEENTPLSELSPTGVKHLRPLASGVGLAWSQELRLSVASVAQHADPTLALIAHLPPSSSELNALVTRANDLGVKASCSVHSSPVHQHQTAKCSRLVFFARSHPPRRG